jgi:hypothetical protein
MCTILLSTASPISVVAGRHFTQASISDDSGLLVLTRRLGLANADIVGM